jgi:UDP-2-acetamido-2-deoxy-ribo-hexuluronate aminotransferase
LEQIPFLDLKAQFAALREPIQKRVQTVLEHCQFIMGPEVEELEKALAKFVGCRHAITCSSGTDAEVIAMMALGIGPGDEVIVPAFSFIATAESVVLLGAVPVYVDVDPKTYNLDPRHLKAALTPKTKAIQPVSLYGHPANMDEINSFAIANNLFVLEDAAQSFGAMYKGQRSCNLSLVAATSFFPAKPLGCFGDGGAIFTSDDELATAIKEVRNHGQKTRYYHTRIGLNGRLDTLQCAILIPKLERFPWELEQRDRIAQKYNQAFVDLKDQDVVIPHVEADCTSAWAQYTLQVPNRDAFQKALQAKGVPTAVHYPTIMPDQPAYKELGRVVSATTSRQLANRVVSLPLFADITDKMQNYVIQEIRQYFSK